MYLHWFGIVFCMYCPSFFVFLFLLELYSRQMLDDLCEGFTCVVLHAFSSADYVPFFAVRLEFYAWDDG